MAYMDCSPVSKERSLDLMILSHTPCCLLNVIFTFGQPLVPMGIVIISCIQMGWVGLWGLLVVGTIGHEERPPRGSALDGAVFDIAQILAYLVHNMSRSQLYLGFGHFGWHPSFFGSITFGRAYGWIVFPLLKLLSFFWLTYYCSYRALSQCKGLVKSF